MLIFIKEVNLDPSLVCLSSLVVTGIIYMVKN